MSAYEPPYVELHRCGELERRAREAMGLLGRPCRVCPREGSVDRMADERGLCKTGRHAVVASHFPHFGEENCLRGWRGSGTHARRGSGKRLDARLVAVDHVWVEGNPKETDLTYVQPGQPVTVTVDTYPGHVWEGAVGSLSPASQASFSLLPAQNTSGNWVKVVQRIPLRVRVETKPDEPQLRAGMSAEIEIDTGHQRHLSDLLSWL